MTESYQPNKNRRFRTPSNPWLPYVGDCKALDTYLNSKEGIPWLAPKFFNALFRGISQVVFANNPLTGVIILLALFWSDLLVGLAATLAAITAIVTALLLRQEMTTISSGLTTFNAVLVGSVTASLWTPLFAEPLSFKIWTFIIVGSILSVFVTSALNNILSSFKISLPCLTMPFNVVALVLFLALMPHPHHHPEIPTNRTEGGSSLALHAMPHNMTLPPVLASPVANNRSTRQIEIPSNPLEEITEDIESSMPNDPNFVVADNDTDPTVDANTIKDPNMIHWGDVLTGVLSSMGQVFGVNNVVGSVLMYIGVLIYSPILCMVSIVGAALASVAGLFFTPAPYTAVYTGIWGYNAILSAGAVGGFFYAMTIHSCWAAVSNVIFTILIQQGLSLVFEEFKLPVFTLPFVLSTMLFLSVTTTGDQLPRVTSFSFPEMHRYEFLEDMRSRLSDKMQNSDIIEEDKELVLKEVKVITEELPEDNKEKEKEIKQENEKEKE